MRSGDLLLELPAVDERTTRRLIADMERRVTLWQRRIGAGELPLTRGEAARAASQIRGMQTTYSLIAEEAQAAGWLSQQLESMITVNDAQLKGLERTAIKGQLDWYRQVGWDVQPNKTAIKTAVRRSQTAITKDFARLDKFTQETIARAVRDNLIHGQGPHATARALSRATSLSRNRARVILRTESKDAYDQARQDLYRRYSDVVTSWTWKSRPDACRLCLALDGLVFDAGEPMDSHHQCRCLAVPVLADETDPTPIGEWTKPGTEQQEQDRERLGMKSNPGWRSQRILKPLPK